MLKQCALCGNPVPYPRSYCDSCQQVMDRRKVNDKRKANQRYNQRRDKKYLRFYNSPPWRLLSQTYMQHAQYLCEECGAIASEVHHIKPIQTPEGWELRLDWDNLKALCLACHNKKHNRFKNKK